MKYKRLGKKAWRRLNDLQHEYDFTLEFYKERLTDLIETLRPDLKKVDLSLWNVGWIPNSVESKLFRIIGEATAGTLYRQGYIVFKKREIKNNKEG